MSTPTNISSIIYSYNMSTALNKSHAITMQSKMVHSTLSFFLALALPIILAIASPDPAQQSSSTDFILTSCSRTRYPDLCYSTLCPYSNSTGDDPSRLAVAAIRVSLKKAQRFASHMSNLSHRDAAPGPGAKAALRDCLETMADAMSEMSNSLKMMKQLTSTRTRQGGGAGKGVALGMSNVQTWMSAALTYEETCSDGFKEVGDGREVEEELEAGLEKVKMVTSNALALVNNYAQKVTP